MLGDDGRLKGDLTIFNWGGGRWWITGSYYLRQWHMRWFNDHLDEGVLVRDLGDEMAGMSLAGPKSREVLRSVLTDGDLDGLKFMGCGQMDVGLVRCHVGRLSVAGELGYELHCRAGDMKALRDTLLAAGADHGMIEYGFNALLSLRLEKSFGIWSAEFTQGYTPGMTGMDRWIDWSKDFIGKTAALAERDGNGPAKVLVTLEVDAENADAAGFEPVWKGDRKIGFVTSGGYAHTLGTSLAMALVDREFADLGSALSVHVVGVERPATVIAASPYDPDGSVMRG
tara:strand:- start:689 stop:1540 length:852 start_codon:yes stop_codon:yes gene_type:complete